MISIDDLWVLEWSENAKCYHSHKLSEAIEKNVEAFRDRRQNDYVPIFVGSEKEMDKASARFHAHTEASLSTIWKRIQESL